MVANIGRRWRQGRPWCSPITASRQPAIVWRLKCGTVGRWRKVSGRNIFSSVHTGVVTIDLFVLLGKPWVGATISLRRAPFLWHPMAEQIRRRIIRTADWSLKLLLLWWRQPLRRGVRGG